MRIASGHLTSDATGAARHTLITLNRKEVQCFEKTREKNREGVGDGETLRRIRT